MNYLDQLGALFDGLPWFIAGDVFDRWDAEPELISELIRCMPPDCWAVPGNHDLPHHRYNERHRSAYWTLVTAKAIRNMGPGVIHHFKDFVATGYPEGHPIRDYHPVDRTINLGVAHKHIWKDGMSYPGADDAEDVTVVENDLHGFDAVVFGDNHQPFLHRGGESSDPIAIYNHGTLIRRRSDERTLKPGVGFLMSDGTIDVVPLDVLQDRWTEDADTLQDIEGLTAAGFQADELLELLRELGDHALCFKDAVLHYLKRNKIGGIVQELVVGWLEKVGKK